MNKQKFTYYFMPTAFKASLLKQAPFFYKFFSLRPSSAVLNITDNCCFRCIMCDQWKGKTDDELSTKNWFDILSQLKAIGIREVVLSGGEPFLRDDIIDIISYAKRMELEVGVITNGYLLNRETVEKTIEAGTKSFSISIDAVGERFDDIRGVKGAYQKVIDSCRLLSEYKRDGVYIYLCFTLMKETLNHYKDVFAIAKEFDFPFAVNLFDYTPYFFKDLKKTKDLFWLDNNDDFHHLKKLQKDFIDKKRKYPKSIYHTYSEIEYFRKYFKDSLQKDIPCVVSQLRIGIGSQGDVYGGCWSMGSFGNLKKESLKDIINSAKYKLTHKNMFFKNCPGCSCGYPKNLRYHMPSLIKEAIFRIAPSARKSIWS